jgi:hypothetical protein
MRILFLDQSGQLGGAELCLLDLAKIIINNTIIINTNVELPYLKPAHLPIGSDKPQFPFKSLMPVPSKSVNLVDFGRDYVNSIA